MGCAGSSGTLTVIANTQSLHTKIKRDIRKLIVLNPFFSIKFTEITMLLKNTINKNKDVADSLEKIKILISAMKRKMSLDDLVVAILRDIFSYASKMLKNIYPKDDNFEINIILTLYFFFNENQQRNLVEKENFFKDLIIKSCSTEDKSNNQKYKIHTGKLFMLIYNILQYSSFSYVYCFIGIAILNNFTSIRGEQLKRLYIDKIYPSQLSKDTINDFILSKLQAINPNCNPSSILSLLTKEIFKPIEEIYSQHQNDDIVEMDNDKILSLSDAFCDTLNNDFYMGIFLSGK